MWNECYWLIAYWLLQKNWFGAFEDCRTRGLYLASILNETEFMEVSRQINDLGKSPDQCNVNTNLWVGCLKLTG